ncbi:unnamed protein product, partial [Mesorhabditis spiculigera]
MKFLLIVAAFLLTVHGVPTIPEPSCTSCNVSQIDWDAHKFGQDDTIQYSDPTTVDGCLQMVANCIIFKFQIYVNDVRAFEKGKPVNYVTLNCRDGYWAYTGADTSRASDFDVSEIHCEPDWI